MQLVIKVFLKFTIHLAHNYSHLCDPGNETLEIWT